MDSNKCPDIIDLSESLLRELSALYMSPTASDVVFIVEEERIFAHKFVLVLRCEYFRLMFASGLRECVSNEVVVKETPVSAFKEVLYFMYTGVIHLNNKKVDDIIDVLFLGHRYEMHELVTAVTDYLGHNITNDNVCAIHETASLFAISPLLENCHQFILGNGYQLLSNGSLLSLSPKTLIQLLSSDDFCAEELDVFNAIIKYLQMNAEITAEVAEELVSTVRLHLISWNDMIAYVWPSGFFAREELLMSIDNRPKTGDNYRKCVAPVLDLGSISQFIVEKSVLYSHKFEPNLSVVQKIPGCVTFDMDCLRFANYMELEFGNCCRTGYSYYVEVSTDSVKWERVADYMDYQCYSTQCIYFPKTAVKQLRIYCGLSGGTNFILNDLKLMIKEFPKNMYHNSRGKSDLDYGSYNPNKTYAPIYGTHHDISSKAKHFKRFGLKS
ncbi:unnamed protein product [Oppiella nova]|uniref:BTB domain-containing protein n=1 Tax=Oppiella nova TaxID=334625 RepID=A0A7R9QH33_9ACAR|nr:unnamed protein product [Oppiella nova]CAG2165643.1 unnamed protein product [Oppiella nova]